MSSMLPWLTVNDLKSDVFDDVHRHMKLNYCA